MILRKNFSKSTGNKDLVCFVLHLRNYQNSIFQKHFSTIHFSINKLHLQNVYIEILSESSELIYIFFTVLFPYVHHILRKAFNTSTNN